MSPEITHSPYKLPVLPPVYLKLLKERKKTLALECATVHILVHLALFIDYIVQNIVQKDQIEKNLLRKVF